MNELLKLLGASTEAEAVSKVKELLAAKTSTDAQREFQARVSKLIHATNMGYAAAVEHIQNMDALAKKPAVAEKPVPATPTPTETKPEAKPPQEKPAVAGKSPAPTLQPR